MTPFDAMQAAVDIVNTSPHPTNKIAATIVGTGPSDVPFIISHVNHWPPALAAKFSPDQQIGNTSGTVHAETACIMAAPCTAGAALFITDPFCPNCAKNIAEAGITHIYIDHKGFDKDWTARRVDDFTDLSLHIVERAGINVSMIYRKEHRIVPMITPSANFVPPDDRPVTIISLECHPGESRDPVGLKDNLITAARGFKPEQPDLPFAAAVIHHRHPQSCHPGEGRDPISVGGPRPSPGRQQILITEAHIIRGYSEGSRSDQAELATLHTGKYTMVMEPVNRLLMTAARMGGRVDPGLIVSSRVPTSRELVNMVAGGYTNLHILDRRMARDVPSVNALESLVHAGVMAIQ